MTEAAPKTCRGCRWAVINDPESWVGGCSMRDHGVDLDETGGVASTCPAHSSADDAKRQGELERAAREAVEDVNLFHGFERLPRALAAIDSARAAVEKMPKEMEEGT